VSAKVQLQIKQDKAPGKAFTFIEHDTFIFGRMPDCHACIADDIQVSRHHFIFEANPPQACLRDLGSLNGTWVNGIKFGGRLQSETPEEGAKRRYPEVNLKDGDIIQVGQTSLEVQIEEPRESPKHCADPALADISLLSPEQLARLIFGAPNDPAEEPKLQIPGYIIEAEIGRGGFGAVYRARHRTGGKIVAVKVMLARVDADDEAIQKFKREVTVSAVLDHPNIVKFLDHGSNGTIFYFLMEFCDGGSVADQMFKCGGRLSLSQAKPIILDALAGLSYAHEKGFVHRDLKPQNILLAKGTARLSDFGLSKNFQQAGLSGLSITGNYAGTPVFMPREQIVNFKHVKPVSDVWSMGATIYNMLTGAFPYPFSEKRDPIDVILNDDVVPVRQRDASVPKGVASVLEKALSKRIKDRYQSAGEMLAALRKMLE
jgi:eukaryotic-like serine/threonine-protein kinase